MELLEQRTREAAPAPREAARRTLAMRIAQRNRLRAERLARLRPGAGAEAAGGPPAAAACDDAGAALEDFLRALAGTGAEPPPEVDEAADETEPPPAAVLPFQRDTAVPGPGFADAAPARPRGAEDIARLPGMGPSLAWAFRRAGIASLAELAPLQEAELVARLGPLGRLVPARAWLAAAREAGPRR